jgi:hypothetical protein
MTTKKNEKENVVEEATAEEEKSTGKKVSEGVNVAADKMGEGIDTASEKVWEGARAAGKTLNEAFKQVEGIGKALGSALSDRANVVMVRVNNESLQYLDMLVEADITKSRSESAAFLINEGIKANDKLFDKIRDITDQISVLRAQLRETVDVEE